MTTAQTISAQAHADMERLMKVMSDGKPRTRDDLERKLGLPATRCGWLAARLVAKKRLKSTRLRWGQRNEGSVYIYDLAPAQ